MHFSTNLATVIIHIFIFASYINAIIGGHMADMYNAKFDVIMFGSSVYCIGTCILSVFAIPIEIPYLPQWISVAVGLGLISIGTGCIKSCVAIFVGDQVNNDYVFETTNTITSSSLYSMFYIIINIGALVGALSIPYIRIYLSYAFAFGIPAVLIWISIIIFFLGKNFYRRVSVSGSNAIQILIYVFFAAWKYRKVYMSNMKVLSKFKNLSNDTSYDKNGQVYVIEEYDDDNNDGNNNDDDEFDTNNFIDDNSNNNKKFSKTPAKEMETTLTQVRTRDANTDIEWTFLDYATKVYSRDVVNCVKRLLNVLKIFIPFPIFWSLYDQMSSRWIFQSMAMNRKIIPQWDIEIYPEQVTITNQILVIILVPIFDRIIYPRLKFKPLTKMSIGMVFMCCGFILSASVEWGLSFYSLSILFQFPQYLCLAIGEVLITITGLDFVYTQTPKEFKTFTMAIWLSTVAMGNLIVAIIAKSNLFGSQSIEFLFYAGIMGIALIIFLFITRNYIYNEPVYSSHNANHDDDNVSKNKLFCCRSNKVNDIDVNGIYIDSKTAI